MIGDIMNGNRKIVYRYRHRRRKFSKRFLVLVSIVVMGVFAYFVIGALGVADEAENDSEEYVVAPTPTPPPPEHIDISLLRTNFDDRALVYIFYYENIEVDMTRHHVIDDEGFVNSISRDPANNSITIHTDVPVIFFTQYSHATMNVYITAVNPREVFNKIVIIDPGHGGADAGSVVGDVHESNITLSISLYLYELFQNSDSDIRAYLTRFDDSFVYNVRRSHIANTVGDLLVSIHTNAYEGCTTVSGTETLFNSNSPMDRYGNLGRFDMSNSDFSQIMQNHLVAELGARDRGLFERRDLLLLNTSSVPTAYVEIDFKTNPQALANLTNSMHQQRVAQALYRGIVEAFNIIP